MPKIEVSHQSQKSPDDCFSIIKNFFETDPDIHGIDPQIRCDFKADSRTGKVQGKQFKAQVGIQSSGAGSTVAVTIELPLILTPLKSKVEGILRKKLQQHLG